MASDETNVKTGIYIGLGLLLAVGAGYAVWRYALSDETKEKAKEMVQEGTHKVRRYASEARRELETAIDRETELTV